MRSLIFLAVFFSLSLHACDSRLLLGVNHNAENKNLQSRTTRNNAGKGAKGVRNYTETPNILPQATRPAAEDQSRPKTKPCRPSCGGEGKVIVANSETAVDHLEEARETMSAVDRTESSGLTVSWLVPHDIHRGFASFNVDYDAPRTHPPSHN